MYENPQWLLTRIHDETLWIREAVERKFQSLSFYCSDKIEPLLLSEQLSTSHLEVLWGQPIKLIQVVSSSKFHEYWWNDFDFIFLSPPLVAGPQKPQKLTTSKTRGWSPKFETGINIIIKSALYSIFWQNSITDIKINYEHFGPKLLIPHWKIDILVP